MTTPVATIIALLVLSQSLTFAEAFATASYSKPIAKTPLQPLRFKNYDLEVETGVTDTHARTADSGDTFEATLTLQAYEQSQQQFMVADGSQGRGGGLSAVRHSQSLSPATRTTLKRAVLTLAKLAHSQRDADSSRGRIALGFCATGAPEALAGLRSWVAALALPRGVIRGMDIDGVPIPIEELGSVYVKYSTGSAVRGRGRESDTVLWQPGDAVLEGYAGDFRGIYFSVELGDGMFRQFGVLPGDLFMEEEEL